MRAFFIVSVVTILLFILLSGMVVRGDTISVAINNMQRVPRGGGPILFVVSHEYEAAEIVIGIRLIEDVFRRTRRRTSVLMADRMHNRTVAALCFPTCAKPVYVRKGGTVDALLREIREGNHVAVFLYPRRMYAPRKSIPTGIGTVLLKGGRELLCMAVKITSRTAPKRRRTGFSPRETLVFMRSFAFHQYTVDLLQVHRVDDVQAQTICVHDTLYE